MNNNLDPDKIRIPAYLRKKAIVRQSKQKLILTALDRKQAGLSVNSQKALAPAKSKVKEKTYSNISKKAQIKKAKATSYQPAPNFFGNSEPLMSKRRMFPEQPKRSKGSFLQSLLPVSNNRDEREEEREQPRQKHQAPTGFVQIIPIGHITAYFEKIQVAVIKLNKPLRIGEVIQITADEMLFQQPVDSMQINRKPVKIAKKGSEIGLKVSHEPQLNGPVYKVLV